MSGINHPEVIHEWPMTEEHPEGLSLLAREDRPGLLVVYDGPDKRRLAGTTVTADGFPFIASPDYPV